MRREVGITIQLCAPLASEQFFDAVLTLCLKKIGEKGRGGSDPTKSLGLDGQVSFSQVFGLDAGETTVLPSKKQQFDMEMFKQMIGRDGLHFADEGEATIALFAIAEEHNGPGMKLALLAKKPL